MIHTPALTLHNATNSSWLLLQLAWPNRAVNII